MREFEHQMAVAFYQWWVVYARIVRLDDRCLFAIPNGGMRNWLVAVKLKEEGVRAGVSDYFLAIPRSRYHGLFIELKAGGLGIKRGAPTKEQLGFGELMLLVGYEFKVAYGALEAERFVEEYLALK